MLSLKIGFFLSLIFLAWAQVPNENSLFEFRQGAEPTVGVLFFVALLITILVYLIKKHGAPFVTPLNWSSLPEREQLRTTFRILLFLCTVSLMSVGFFHLFGTEWVVAYQTLGFSIIGFYATWSEDKQHMWLYCLFSLFNWFCLSGKLAFLGYSQNLAELTTTGCIGYYYLTEPNPPTIVTNRCITNGYLNWLRLVGLGAILVQGVTVYLSYRFVGLENDTGRGEYTQVNDGPTFFAGNRTGETVKVAPTSSSASKPSLVFSSPYQQDSYQSGASGNDDNVM